MAELRRGRGLVFCPQCARWVPESQMREKASRYEWQALVACKGCLSSACIVSARAQQSSGRGMRDSDRT